MPARMDKLKKPTEAFVYTLALLAALVITRFEFSLADLFFLAGGLVGAYVWEYEVEVHKALNHPNERPLLRNIFTQTALAVGALYAASTSTSLVATGLALGLYGRSVVEQVIDWRGGKSFERWLWPVKTGVGETTAKGVIAMTAGLGLLIWLLLVFG